MPLTPSQDLTYLDPPYRRSFRNLAAGVGLGFLELRSGNGKFPLPADQPLMPPAADKCRLVPRRNLRRKPHRMTRLAPWQPELPWTPAAAPAAGGAPPQTPPPPTPN